MCVCVCERKQAAEKRPLLCSKRERSGRAESINLNWEGEGGVWEEEIYEGLNCNAQILEMKLL